MSIDWQQGLPVLRGEGIILREPRIADADALFARLTSRSVTRFLSTPPDSAAGFGRFIGWVQHERQQGRHLCYAIVPDGAADAVGLIQMREIEPGFGTAEWGFAMAEAFWGSGVFMTSARLSVDFVFRHVGVHRLEARASVKNGRGNGVLQKLGAVPEGVLRRSFDNGAQATDQVLWSLIADDWLAASPDQPYVLDHPVTSAPETEWPASLEGHDALWRRGLPELRGEHVLLRELEADDAGPLTGHFSHADVGRYISPPPVSLEAFGRFVTWAHKQRELGSYFCYAVIPEGEQHPVGIFQIHRLEPTFSIAEWGFVFAKPFWGTGVFVRSARVLLAFIFDTLKVKRLEARAMADNLRANAVLRKLGAVEEGRLRRSFLLGGQYHDDVLWSLLDSDWSRHRGTGPVAPDHP